MSTSAADCVFKKPCKFCIACPNNSRENSELSYFRIPKDDARCSIWKAILKVDKLKEFTAEECYSAFAYAVSTLKVPNMFSSFKKDKLKKEAVPSSSVEEIHPIEQDTSLVDDSEYSQMCENVVGTSQSTQLFEDIVVIDAPFDDINQYHRNG